MRISAAAIALLLTSTAAIAADLAPAPVEPVAPVVVPFSWTGFYAGANVGYAFGGRDTVGIHDPAFLGDLGKLTAKGFLGGLQAGYNYQFDNIVVGIETDFQGAQIKDTVHGVVAGEPGRARSDIKWYGTLRPRIGYAYDRFLIYATGGLAYGNIDYKLSYNGASFSDSNTKVGWTAGAGLEYAFTDNLSGRVEYQYVNFGSYTVRGAGTLHSKASPDFHAVRLGVNYKF
ncbi:porin family protein [Labrys sp. LIt4]|uniref:Porin family protein n=1 Tax=Labrys okinawensis TaxID=346911 RepID=A0A2S9QG84_9HYPH|nr:MULTISPECIES: outer membrane protein [Labrys]MBP0579788.1 porin family protein [Labrys sp. LIt4]PRH88344.1 porin family protein [Labrys okinawensis]